MGLVWDFYMGLLYGTYINKIGVSPLRTRYGTLLYMGLYMGLVWDFYM